MVTVAARPEPEGDPAGEPGHLQLTTLAGWRGFVTEMPSAPDLLPDPVWTGLEEGKRACYDDDRIDHHSRLLVVQTPAIRQVINSGRRLIQLNKNACYGPWTPSRRTSPPSPRARLPPDHRRCCPETKPRRSSPWARPDGRCAPSPSNSAAASPPSAAT